MGTPLTPKIRGKVFLGSGSGAAVPPLTGAASAPRRPSHAPAPAMPHIQPLPVAMKARRVPTAGSATHRWSAACFSTLPAVFAPPRPCSGGWALMCAQFFFGGGVWFGMPCVSGRRVASPSRPPLRARGRGSSRRRHRAGWCTQGGREGGGGGAAPSPSPVPPIPLPLVLLFLVLMNRGRQGGHLNTLIVLLGGGGGLAQGLGI